MEFCEAMTLESDEKDSTDEHGTIIFKIPCSFNATPESGMLSALCTHEDYNHLMVLFCKTFRRLDVDVYVYRKHCRFHGCIVSFLMPIHYLGLEMVLVLPSCSIKKEREKMRGFAMVTTLKSSSTK